MKTIKQAKLCYILSSLLFCAAGLLLIVFPRISSLTLCYALGSIAVFYGITKILGYLSRDLYNLAFQFDLSLGVFVTAIGLIMLIKADKVIMFLPIVIGIFVLVDGVFKLQTAVDAKRFGLSNWWLILLGGLLCVALGMVLVFDPMGSGDAMIILIGISILVDGIQNLFNAFYTVKIMQQDEKFN